MRDTVREIKRAQESEKENGALVKVTDSEDTPHLAPNLTPNVSSHKLPSSVLKDTAQSSIREESSWARKRSSSDLLTDTPICGALNDIKEEMFVYVFDTYFTLQFFFFLFFTL